MIAEIRYHLERSMTVEYANAIAEAICDEVAEDLAASADERWSDGDIHMAIGRALCRRLNIEA